MSVKVFSKVLTPSGTSYYVTPEQVEKHEKKQRERTDRQKLRPHGEVRGWEITESDGYPVWQMIPGGWFQPV